MRFAKVSTFQPTQDDLYLVQSLAISVIGNRLTDVIICLDKKKKLTLVTSLFEAIARLHVVLDSRCCDLMRAAIVKAFEFSNKIPEAIYLLHKLCPAIVSVGCYPERLRFFNHEDNIHSPLWGEHARACADICETIAKRAQ